MTLVDEDAHSKVADIEVGIVECSSDSSVTALSQFGDRSNLFGHSL